MLRDRRFYLYAGGAVATAAVAVSVLPSEDVVFCPPSVFCVPLSVQMGDEPSQDGPVPTPLRLVARAVSSSTVSMPGTAFLKYPPPKTVT